MSYPAFLRFLSTLAVAATLCGPAIALDSIRIYGSRTSMPGRVTGMDPINVELTQGSTAVREVPVNQIQMIQYEGEPRDLRKAREHVLESRYAEALASLERIKEDTRRTEIQQDIDFYKALATAKLALGGHGKIAAAGRMMNAFIEANPKSYHYFQASEIVGDLLVASRRYAPATEYYARLAKAPWPDYKMRADVATGWALLEQGQTRDAEAAFDKVLADPASGIAAQRQRIAANIGKAATLLALKKPDAAVKQVEKVLRDVNTDAASDDAPLAARAYNLLGTAHRQAGRTKEALLAFLHVELIYSGVPDAHAEALVNLAELWDQVHKAERANRARQTLLDLYPDSPWAQKRAK